MAALTRGLHSMPSAQLQVLSGGPKVIPAPSAGTFRSEAKPELAPEFDRPSLYLNPELSLLGFQCRVLEEARDSRNPLLERVKFLAILSSNLDEFFMVRVAGLLQQIENGVQDASIDGRRPARNWPPFAPKSRVSSPKPTLPTAKSCCPRSPTRESPSPNIPRSTPAGRRSSRPTSSTASIPCSRRSHSIPAGRFRISRI